MDRALADTQRATHGPDRHRLLFEPNVRIHGLIDDRVVEAVLEDMRTVRENESDLYMEIDTPGGDADGGRRIALEIKLFLKHSGRSGYVIGKNTVYSAGITILAGFPKTSRFLCEQAVLLIHERRLEKDLTLNGPIRSCLQIVREQLALLETAEQLENEGFADLVRGSKLSVEELRDHAMNSFYLMADKALELDIVEDIAR